MAIDDNKHVQKAGCSALAALEEEAGPDLAPYLELMLRNLVVAFETCQKSNMYILYDAVKILADAVGSALQNPTYVRILMSTLIKRLSKLKKNDDELVLFLQVRSSRMGAVRLFISRLQCLASVTIAMGPAVLPYSIAIFDWCHTVVHASLAQYEACQQIPKMDKPDCSFLAAFDLLCGLMQGLGMKLEQHIVGSQSKIFELLTICMKHPHAAVRQSGYALVGCMSMNCFPLLQPQVPSIMRLLTAQLDADPEIEFTSAYDNAAWAAGEIALQFGHGESISGQVL